MRQRALAITATFAAVAALAACGDDDDAGSDTTAAVTATVAPATTGAAGTTEPTGTSATTDAPPSGAIDPDRCAANEDAGTISYLSGFDFAAAAGIVDVIVADAAGYYDDMCLDVELLPSFSTANYPLIASGDAQMASAGSFSEMVQFAAANEAELVAVIVDGRTPIDSLIVKKGEATELADLAGTTIGVKGKLPPSIGAMLATAGLHEGEDFETVLLDGFDPLAHIEVDGIVGFPGYKSNEPGQLERAGIPFDLFDPADEDVPGSFGVIFTTRQFIDQNPTAAQDFVRATMRGLADAIDDPDAASATALDLINGNGNPNFLSPEGETFRRQTESELVASTTPDGTGFGVPDPAGLQAELDAYAEVGLFADADTPSADDHLDPSLMDDVYDDQGQVIWPG